MRKIFLFFVPLLFCVFGLNAQTTNAEENAAIRLVSASKAELGLSAEDLGNVMVSSTYFDNASGVTRVYLNQTYKGIPVYNQMLVLAYKGDKLVSQAGAFHRNVEKFMNARSGVPAVTAESAVQSALSDRGMRANQMAVALNRKNNGNFVEFGNMGISRENITAQLMWTPLENKHEINLSWHVYIIPKTTADYWMVRVDATNNSILGMDNYTDYCDWGTPDVHGRVNYPAFAMGNPAVIAAEKQLADFKKSDDPSVVNTATYRVIPFPYESPIHTPTPFTTETRVDPWLSAPGNATSLKWHTGLGATDYEYSRGNNVWAYHDRAAPTNTGTVAKSASSTTALPNLTFDFLPDFTQEPIVTTPPNQQFNITNLFYWNNVIHDVMYVYGFAEVNGNFQDDNQGRGGAGNDHVNAEAQDAGGTNNANFSTPADGTSGRMQMYLWTAPTPDRDGDVDNGIIIHEYGHGISNRLTGGPANVGCLSNAEQMGEGWSDYYALMLTQNWATATLNTGFNSPRGIGTYAVNQATTGPGIRPARYTTDMAINNYTYANLPSLAVPHGVGFLWCTIIWDMTWNIINQNGVINPNIYNFAAGGGNAIALKIVTEALKIQQCAPGFVSGRNAILQADQILYGGTYNCAIWEAFRRRGVGAFASEGSTASTNDQVVDFTPPITMAATVSATTIPEGSNLLYTNSLTTCAAITGYTLRDTLPTNVTYVSGGTYDAATRVVSFAANQGAGTTNYPFTVNVNPGSYFPPIILLNEPIAVAGIPAGWAATSAVGPSNWVSSTTTSQSAPNSLFAVDNAAAVTDFRVSSTTPLALGAVPMELTFWHNYNTEATWDGGVVEISTNGGTTWIDLGPNMTVNGYNSVIDPNPLNTNPIRGRAAFTGNSSGWIQTTVDLAAYVNQSALLRFRMTSDDNTANVGWYVDDIMISARAKVKMRSSLFNASNTRVSFRDMVTEITQLIACEPTITQQPVDAAACAGNSASFTCVGTAVGGVTYQWQVSTTGIGGTYSNLTNVAPYSNVTTSTMTINPAAIGMDGYYYRCVVTGTCAPNATSNPARLSVAAASTGGSVTPATSQVCGTTNSGVLTLSGHIGNVIRWESATNIAGPWTAIANTTTTYTFVNITQTTYYRAVVQFGSCAPGNSTIATVNFVASAPLTIVADPGTTICAGDPTLLTVMEAVVGAPPIPVSITHSSSNAITPGNSVSCGTFITTAVNSFWRVYDLATFPTVIGAYTINSVRFGIELSSGGAQNVTVRLYNQTGGAFPGGTRTQIATQTFSVPNTSLGFFTANLTTPVTVPNNSVVVVEIQTSGTAGRRFFIGSNAAPETSPSYLSAVACAIANPTTTAAIGFPNMHILLSLGGTVPGLGPVTTGTFLWTPAAGLSSTTTNPVAASPMTTTTYTVNHNNGAGCIRQANITITVNVRPVVTTQPVSVTVCNGATATFTAAGNGTALAYQWQVSQTGPGGPWTNLTNVAPYSGVTTPTLVVNPVTLAMSGYNYRVVLTGACAPVGTANISNAVVLTVNALPAVTVTPTSGCGGVAGINGLLLTASGATSYTWAPIAGLYTNAIATIPYTGGNTATVYAAPTAFTAYTVTGTSATTGCSNTATALINYTPPAPTVIPSSVTMCLGDPAVKLKSSSATSSVMAFNSGVISVPIPDNSQAGASHNLTVSGIPANATVTGMRVKMTIPHTFIGDLVIALRAPNNNVLNLDFFLSNSFGGVTTGFLNTVITSAAGAPALSTGSNPYTASFRADGQIAATGNGPAAPTGYTANMANFNALISTLTPANVNGVYTLAMYDGGAIDLGTLTNWEIEFTYVQGVPATPAVWTPAAGLFSDALATVPYVAGTPVDSVWARPTPSGVYPYQVTVQSLGLQPTAIQTTFTNNNQFAMVTTNFRNNNAFPVTISGFESIASTNGASVATLFYKTTPVNGAPGAISAANGWNVAGTGPFTAIANTTTTTPQPMLSGLSLVIPAGATYGLAFQSTTAALVGNLRYSTVAAGTYINSGGGCDVIAGTSASYAGGVAPLAPTFTPRAFIGRVLFGNNTTPCTSPARTVVVTVNQPTTLNATLPANQTICTDKVATFTVAVTDGTGPHSYRWQVSTDNGNTWTNISNGGVYSGVTTATLTVTAPPVSMSGYQYHAIVTGAAPCAASTSRNAILTVNPKPTVVITANPYTSLLPGMATTISSTVSPNAAASYTWLRNGVAVAGANSATIVVDIDGLGDYQLLVNDVNGCSNVSNIITIKDSVSAKCFIYPNPTSGKFQVRYYSVANNVLPRTLTIYDAKGDRVFTQYYTIGRPYDRMDVDMRAYGKGMYWVEIGDLNGNRLSMCRVVIQ